MAAYNVYVASMTWAPSSGNEIYTDIVKAANWCATNTAAHTSDSSYTKTLTCNSMMTGRRVAPLMPAHHLACSS